MLDRLRLVGVDDQAIGGAIEPERRVVVRLAVLFLVLQGGGRPVVDLLRQAGLQPIAVSITSGRRERYDQGMVCRWSASTVGTRIDGLSAENS